MLYSRDILSLVTDLIERKNEGEYWDFKQEFHDNKAQLIHDILCFANRPELWQPAYIIYGVTDTGEVLGLEECAPRPVQHQILDFLSTLPFAAQNRPMVNVHKLSIKDKMVDVLEIENSEATPFYLTDDYRDRDKCVRRSHIYSRSGSKNTPIDKMADPGRIEMLWKKRLGQLHPPGLRMEKYLRSMDHWVVETDSYYWALDPIFTVKKIPLNHPAGLWPAFGDTPVVPCQLEARYHSTTLFTVPAIQIASRWYVRPLGARYLSGVTPYLYCYYLEDSLEYLFVPLLFNTIPRLTQSRMIPSFKNHLEKVTFDGWMDKRSMENPPSDDTNWHHVIGSLITKFRDEYSS